MRSAGDKTMTIRQRSNKMGRDLARRSEHIEDTPLPGEPTREERIYQVILSIPPGRVATYGQVADLAGLPRGARMVGRALSNLPTGSRLPWYRVVNASGQSSLPPAGAKRQYDALRDEGVAVVRGRVNLKTFRWRLDP